MLKKLFLVFLLLSGCSGPSPAPVGEEPPAEPPVDFSWMLGNWQRGDDKPGRTTFEQWSQDSETSYLGTSYTMAAGDTIWQEEMRLIADTSGWMLEVNGEGETIPFRLTTIGDKSFISENPEHDFPKVITYVLRGDSLAAAISGEGTEIPFTFGPVRN